MPRSQKQKLKLLYLMQMLLNRSDEQHPLPMEQIIASLNSCGISAERKSVYDDIDALRLYGLDVRLTKSKPGGYFVACRDFEVPELKILVDSVQASQFITEKKTLQLIKKLEGLCSTYEARQMRRQVYVSRRIKHMNESIYYSVDAIHNAIAEDHQIRFLYFEYTVDKKKAYRHNGKMYQVSPFALTWDHENYYLIAFDSDANMIKHYRVDRMERISPVDLSRLGSDSFVAHDMDIYTSRTFSMFGGEETQVDLTFENHLARVVMDRFGKDIPFRKADDAHFHVTAHVMVSPQFYAWVFGLGEAARITGPAEVADGMRRMLQSVMNSYPTAP